MTLFSRIIAGQIPCHRVYEDEHVLAFLDIEPLAPGHTLLIPKREVATLGELDDEAAAALGRVLPRLCRAVCGATGTWAYNVLQNNGSAAGQGIDHVHFHIIPKTDAAGLEMRWDGGHLDDEEAQRLRGEIASRMESREP